MTDTEPRVQQLSHGLCRETGIGSKDLAGAGLCVIHFRRQAYMYKRLPVKKLTGSEQFKNTGGKKFSVLEFWRYGFSNLNSNVLRGVLAEFIIENAIKDSGQATVRSPWGDYDVLAPNGKKIEVKCCSYIQDWDQKELSKIVWTGLKAKDLYYSSAVSNNLKLTTRKTDYKADIYVFCLLKHQDPKTLDILNMDQWCFYVLSKEKVKEISRNGNSISLVRLEKIGMKPISFKEIEDAIIRQV